MGGVISQGKRQVGSIFTGVDPRQVGSTVSNPSGPAHTQSPADQAAALEAERQAYLAQQQQQQQHAQGFMNSMMGHGQSIPGLSGAMDRTLPPPPPPQWSYAPGHGPVWQTPERTINREGSNPTEMNWKMVDSKPGGFGGGNRF